MSVIEEILNGLDIDTNVCAVVARSLAQEIAAATRLSRERGVEVGFKICQASASPAVLKASNLVLGDETSVPICRAKCPPTHPKTIGSFHTHARGIGLPSPHDLIVEPIFGCVTNPWEERMACFDKRKPEARKLVEKMESVRRELRDAELLFSHLCGTAEEDGESCKKLADDIAVLQGEFVKTYLALLRDHCCLHRLEGG